MAVINDPGCVVVNANTGMPDCPFLPDKIVGIMLFDKDTVFTANEASTVALFITKLQALALVTGQTRIYPIPGLIFESDNSTAPTIVTDAYDGKKVTKDGKYDWTFDMPFGGALYHKKLRLYNKQKKNVLLWDEEGNVYGTLTSAGLFATLSTDFVYAHPWKIHTGADAAKFQIQVALSKTKQLNEDLAVIKTGMSIEDNVKGLIDVTLEQLAATTSKLSIKMYTKDDRIDLYDTYAAALQTGGVSSFVVISAIGTAITPASIALNASTKCLELNSAAAFATGCTVKLASVTILAGFSMGNITIGNGFESNTLTISI
jgi:hypothetical protein